MGKKKRKALPVEYHSPALVPEKQSQPAEQSQSAEQSQPNAPVVAPGEPAAPPTKNIDPPTQGRLPRVKPDMRVTLAGLELTNPVIAASGTFGYGIEFEEIVRLDGIGGFVTKGISMEPMNGHAAPRIVQTAAGMLNAIGLQNVGVEEFIAHKLPPLSRYPRCNVIVNVFGYTVGEYVAVIDRLNQAEGIAAYELNVSCPNVHAGGMAFGSDAGSLEYLVSRAKSSSRRPLIVKLSPNVTSIAHMAKIAEDAGADAVSLTNTFLAMSIDTETRRPRLTNITGGLSGPAIKPIALRMVYETASAVNIPILGMGGIVTPEDAVEFLLAGATAIQVGTASYADPRATERLARGLESWCKSHDVEHVSSLTGAIEIPHS
jgi:dihydroorotate dehydrogenase (NAD+) catalytic subunit